MYTPEDAVLATLRASSVIRRRLSTLLSASGVTLSQYHVLRILRGSLDGLPTMEIGARLLDQQPAITRLIDGLNRLGFIERRRSKEDRRRVDCRITPQGLDVLRQLDHRIVELDQAMLQNLSEAEIKHLTSLLLCVDEG